MLSTDSLALLLACSQLALADGSAKSLTLREWNPLARKLQAAALRPADLLQLSESDLCSKLRLDVELAARISNLVSRFDELQKELDQLSRFGIFPITRADKDYPERYRQRLKESAPAVLFYAGEKALLGQPGIAVVGSRHLDEAGQDCARFVGNACGLSGQVLYSGGAKGVDTLSMEAALAACGSAVGVLADSLLRAVKSNKEALKGGDLCLVTPYSPNAGFSVGAAMGRNRLIYCLADYAIVIASDAETGGTWAGATEALKHEWLPIFALKHENMPEGNRQLLQRGALAFPHPFKESHLRLANWMKEKSSERTAAPTQPALF